MRTFKKILTMISNIILVPICLVLIFSGLWHLLPSMATTTFGEAIIKFGITDKIMFWILIISASIFLILMVLQAILGKLLSAKFKNFFIHLNTWLMCLLTITLSIATFILVNPLVAEEVTINLSRKISIGAILVALIIYHLFANKLLTIINRRIQAYETAKESNIVGRGSVLVTNFLKLFEILFPEMLILGLMCACVSFNIAIYFLIVLISTFIPMIGNVACDINIRNEIKRKQEIEKDLAAERVAKRLREGNK